MPTRRGAARPWTVPDVPVDQLPLMFHVAQRSLPEGTEVAMAVRGTDSHRAFSELLPDLITGAGFALASTVRTDRQGMFRARVVREPTLADSVGPGMHLLICGVNPSPFSAAAGVGYARPGNRFWPAALEAGLVDADRDPVAALARGVGMTDFSKRPTRTAAEVTRAEYGTGFDRVSRLVAWLQPGAICFVGLSGWRTVMDPHSVAGPQPHGVAGRPVYVMPSTSGLNARTSLSELAGHLAAVAELGTAGV